jgi:hypothetical protein
MTVADMHYCNWNDSSDALWEGSQRRRHAWHDKTRDIVPERPVRIGGDKDNEPPATIMVIAAWGLVFALAAVAFAFSAAP